MMQTAKWEGRKEKRGKRTTRTCNLSASKANTLLILPPLVNCRYHYRLAGWLELLLSGSKKNGAFVVQSVNLTGTPELETAPSVLPKFIHISLRAPSQAANVIADGRSSGILNLSVDVTYPELGSVASHRGKPSRGGLPPVSPISAQLALSYSLDLRTRRFVACGAALLPEFRPFAPAPVGLCCNIVCTIAEDVECLEMCLDIKVAPDDHDRAIISDANVKDLIKRVNRIWGCAVPGQCCIRLNVRRIVVLLKPRLNQSVLLRPWKESGDFKEVMKLDRAAAPKCYNLYIVRQIIGPSGQRGIDGQTGYADEAAGQPLDGSIVTTGEGGYTDERIATIIGHELGHAMDLAPSEADDPDGVTGHSTKGTNLMSTVGAGNQLNAKQCEKARKSQWVTSTKSRCNPAPDE